MTAATDYSPTPKPLNRFAEWVGHRAGFLFLTGCIGAFPLALLRPSWTTTAINETATITLLAVYFLGLRHRRRLCEPCIASMPLDGQARAHAQRSLLRFAHWVGTWQWLMLTGFALVDVWVLPRYGPVRMVGDMVAVSPMLWLLHCQNVHFRLQAWCPQCHWGDGGDGIPEPSPDPAIPQPL